MWKTAKAARMLYDERMAVPMFLTPILGLLIDRVSKTRADRRKNSSSSQWSARCVEILFIYSANTEDVQLVSIR